LDFDHGRFSQPRTSTNRLEDRDPGGSRSAMSEEVGWLMRRLAMLKLRSRDDDFFKSGNFDLIWLGEGDRRLKLELITLPLLFVNVSLLPGFNLGLGLREMDGEDERFEVVVGRMRAGTGLGGGGGLKALGL